MITIIMDINKELTKQDYFLGIRELHKPNLSVESFKSTKRKQQFPELPSCEAERRPTLLSNFSIAQHFKPVLSPHPHPLHHRVGPFSIVCHSLGQ